MSFIYIYDFATFFTCFSYVKLIEMVCIYEIHFYKDACIGVLTLKRLGGNSTKIQLWLPLDVGLEIILFLMLLFVFSLINVSLS